MYHAMSQNNTNTTPEKHYDILKIVAMALGLVGLIILPIGMYAIGQLLSVHLAFSDLNTGYSQSAFYQVVYNATHVQEYSQMAQLNQGEAINIASQDENTVSLLMLGFGLLADIPLALKVREWVAEL
jgi:hypothetical protein